MPGPGSRQKYPRGLFWRMKQNKKSKDKSKGKSKRPGGYATGGRVGKSHGGSVSSRLSKSGPVGKPN